MLSIILICILEGENEDDDDECKTPGFKHAEGGLSTIRERRAERKREEVYTFAQNSPKEQEVKSTHKLGSNNSKHKLDLNQFTLSKPKVRLSPIVQRENKENANVNRKPPKMQLKKPSFRVLPSLKKGCLA